jgi:hypothetical protein
LALLSDSHPSVRLYDEGRITPADDCRKTHHEILSYRLPTDGFDPSTVSEEMAGKIHALNAEMEAAGALFFAGGQAPASPTKTLRASPLKCSGLFLKRLF